MHNINLLLQVVLGAGGDKSKFALHPPISAGGGAWLHWPLARSALLLQ